METIRSEKRIGEVQKFKVEKRQLLPDSPNQFHQKWWDHLPRRMGVSEAGRRWGWGVRIVEKITWGADNWELVKESEPEMNCGESLSGAVRPVSNRAEMSPACPARYPDSIQSSLHFP